MRVFIAGIMQGSHPGAELHAQNYRQRLREQIALRFPQAEIYDPLSDHQNSIEYDDRTARDTFYDHNRMCRQVDLLVAYAPEASMGTAIEMWEAHEHGHAAVVAISPLAKNWAIRFCSHAMYPDLPSFESALKTGEIDQLLNKP